MDNPTKGQEAVQAVWHGMGKDFACTAEEWPEARRLLEAQAVVWGDVLGNTARADDARALIARMDALHGATG